MCYPSVLHSICPIYNDNASFNWPQRRQTHEKIDNRDSSYLFILCAFLLILLYLGLATWLIFQNK